jgi:membrane-bound serine protease (ClpP class)
MKILLALAAAIAALASSLAFAVPAGPSALHLIEVNGSINPGSAAYILDSLKLAEAAQAQGLILRLNTPGGLLSSTRDIIQGISAAKTPVIVFVSPGGASATSAGALITISAHVAVMSPGTNIGAAHPVGSGGEDVKGTMGEKVTNDTAALARAQATLRGRDPQTAALIVTKSESFSPEEALKKKAIDLIAPNVDGLLTQLDGRKINVGGESQTLSTKGLTAENLVRVEMSLKQKVLHMIADPNISALLLTLGGLAIYAEVASGFSVIVPGVFGLFCLLLAFVSLQTIPLNVGGALLFALGFALLAAEVFVTSYGLLTLAALVCLFLGGLFLVDPAATDLRVSLSLLIPLVAGVGICLAFLAYIVARDRRAGKTINTGDQVVGALARVQSVEGSGHTGRAYANGELWAFDSDETLRVGDEAPVSGLRGVRLQLQKRRT